MGEVFIGGAGRWFLEEWAETKERNHKEEDKKQKRKMNQRKKWEKADNEEEYGEQKE